MLKKKITTIEDLAEMTQRGFLDLESRLGKRIDGLEKKVDKGFALIDQRFVELESRMSNLELRMKELDGRMDSLEEFNEEIIERLGRIEQIVDEDQQARIKRLEDSMQRVYEQLAMK